MSVFSQLRQRLNLQGLLNIFLAAPCPLCETPATGLCPTCQRQLRRCRLPNGLALPSSPIPVLTWGSYQGQLRQAIGALKYQQQTEIARFLGSELGQLWSPSDLARGRKQSPTVVPIPLHADRLRQRGYNQAELLAYWFCHMAQLPYCPNGLVRVRATTAQHRLSAQQRQQNLTAAFSIGPGLATGSHSVLLLDDIYTTGATAQAAATTLEQHGIEVVGIGVVARALPAAHTLP